MKEKAKSAVWAIVIIIVIILFITFVFKPQNQEIISATFSKKSVTITTEDTIKLSADLYEPDFDEKEELKKYPGIVLLSPFGESRELYAEIATELSRRQFVVLTVDVRNSGESKVDNESVIESIAKLGIDANTAVQFMLKQSNVKHDKIAVLGTALTARSALMIKNLNNTIKGVVMVSAVMDSTGFRVIEASPDCPILVLVSIQDGNAGSQALDIYKTSQNSLSKIESYFNAGRGSDLWRAPIRHEMMDCIIKWLTDILKGS